MATLSASDPEYATAHSTYSTPPAAAGTAGRGMETSWDTQRGVASAAAGVEMGAPTGASCEMSSTAVLTTTEVTPAAALRVQKRNFSVAPPSGTVKKKVRCVTRTVGHPRSGSTAMAPSTSAESPVRRHAVGSCVEETTPPANSGSPGVPSKLKAIEPTLAAQ